MPIISIDNQWTGGPANKTNTSASGQSSKNKTESNASNSIVPTAPINNNHDGTDAIIRPGTEFVPRNNTEPTINVPEKETSIYYIVSTIGAFLIAALGVLLKSQSKFTVYF